MFKLYDNNNGNNTLLLTNRGRNEMRAMLTYLMDIKSYVQNDHQCIHEKMKKQDWLRKVKTDDFLEYSEQLCIKCLERPNELLKEEEQNATFIGRYIQIVVTSLRPETRQFYSKYWDTWDTWDTWDASSALPESKTTKQSDSAEDLINRREDDLRKELEATHKLDVNTDKFTELIGVFYGFIDIGDDIEHLKKQKIKPNVSEIHKQERSRLVHLLNEYNNNIQLNDDEDRELFKLYTAHFNKRSPKSINEERDRVRAILAMTRRINICDDFCDDYKIKWDIPDEGRMFYDYKTKLWVLCDDMLNFPKRINHYKYKLFKVYFNFIAYVVHTIPRYRKCWKEYIKTDGVYKKYTLHLDTTENIVSGSCENDLKIESGTLLIENYFDAYVDLHDYIGYMEYKIRLDKDCINFYRQQVQPHNDEYLQNLNHEIKDKRRLQFLIRTYIRSKEKGIALSTKHDKELYRLFTAYKGQSYTNRFKINEFRDIIRARLTLATEIGDSPVWSTINEKKAISYILDIFKVRCISYLEQPGNTSVIDLYSLVTFFTKIAQMKPQFEELWKKYRLSIKEIHDKHRRRKDNVITMSPEHDVKTDRFTELAEYFYGFDRQEDALNYFTYLLRKIEALEAYYKENPDKQKRGYDLSDIHYDIRFRKYLVSFMNKYMKGKRLTIREDRGLYRLYADHRAIASPIGINRERQRNRKLLKSISTIRNSAKKISMHTVDDLDKLEHLCIKLLERPKEVTSSDYTEFARLRDGVLSLKRKTV